MIECSLPAVNVRGNVSGNVLSGVSDPGAFIRSLSPAAWYRFNKGITVVGAGVDKWADQSGNGRDLRQTTDTNRPLKNVDGSITFDGVDNYLKTAGFTFNQPCTLYLLLKYVTFTNNDYLCDGNTANSLTIYQDTAAPKLTQFLTAGGGSTNGLALNTLGVLTAVFNNASSTIQANDGTAGTGNPGATNAGGFTLGADGAGNNASNITALEALLVPGAQVAVTNTRVYNYLRQVGGL